jgi:hypothetical protein
MCVVLLLGLTLLAQEAPDAAKIDAAAKKGIAYLRTQEAELQKHFEFQNRRMYHRELALWTLINAAISPTDPLFQKLLDNMLKDKMEATTAVALQAMILEFLDRVRFQVRIAMCAQFLVDNQNSSGQWGYGSPDIYVEDLSTDFKPIGKPGPLNAPQNPKVARKIPIKKNRDGEGGDTSNSFFAALGMRACHDAGITFEPKVIELGARAWRESRQGDSDAGWGYDFREGPTYPSATAGGAAALVIYGYMLGFNLKKDSPVNGALSGLGKSWNVTEMTGMNGLPTRAFHHYALYSVGVAATLSGARKFGDHDWHAEGAKALLEQQNADGSWGSNGPGLPLPQAGLRGVSYVSNALWDTCLAILFLKHGIQPIPEPPKKK